MKILVTGGAGFIGSHLVERLCDNGHHVILFDNLHTGALVPYFERSEFVRGDVCQPFHFEVDQIYHLACPASPVHYQRNPVRTIQTAVLGTMHALQLARDTGARLVITSTSEVYGDPDAHPQKETYNGNVNPIGPRACYDEGKRCGEALAAAWAEQYGTDVRIARLFNTYGPRMAAGDGRLLPNLITQALRGDPLTVYGTGEQTRSFCYVDDTVAGLVALMATPKVSRRPIVVNLGNPDERTIISVAMDVMRLCGTGGVRLERKDLPIDDPKQRCPDITRAKTLLEWEPRMEWAEGLGKTVEWFRGTR